MIDVMLLMEKTMTSFVKDHRHTHRETSDRALMAGLVGLILFVLAIFLGLTLVRTGVEHSNSPSAPTVQPPLGSLSWL